MKIHSNRLRKLFASRPVCYRNHLLQALFALRTVCFRNCLLQNLFASGCVCFEKQAPENVPACQHQGKSEPKHRPKPRNGPLKVCLPANIKKILNPNTITSRHRESVTFSRPSDIQLALQQHKAGLLYEAVPVTQPQQLPLCQLPCKPLVVLLSSFPACHSQKFNIADNLITQCDVVPCEPLVVLLSLLSACYNQELDISGNFNTDIVVCLQLTYATT